MRNKTRQEPVANPVPDGLYLNDHIVDLFFLKSKELIRSSDPSSQQNYASIA